MEVSYQSINNLILVTWINKNLRIIKKGAINASLAALAALSKERTDVVPTAITRLPLPYKRARHLPPLEGLLHTRNA